MIPEVSGIDVLRQIRQHSELKLVPVIVLTNSFVSENAALFMSLGANMYITKLEHDINYIIKKVNDCIDGACVMTIADIGRSESLET
jgi:CheY-like chemotaxis protein